MGFRSAKRLSYVMTKYQYYKHVANSDKNEKCNTCMYVCTENWGYLNLYEMLEVPIIDDHQMKCT
jgi:Pyruvate/2-oxoacid:ferredoxin oxidoreductase delta subunit